MVRAKSGKPAVKNGKLFGRNGFVETNAHAEARADINDAGEKIELLTVMIEFHAYDRAGGGWIECIDVASSAANVAGAGRQTRA